MAKATKTFKIGEYAIGGIIKVIITGKVILIKNLDWNTKEEVRSGSTIATERNARYQIMNYLEEVTSYYYADKITNWIESKISLS